ncbi:MAG: primosomal protein N' [Bacillota bacterium]|nr:primosomal protein N' [Bacillota bacterium]
MGVAQVIVDIAHSDLDRVFDYAIPEEYKEGIIPGSRVLVPFGAGNRPTEGYVLALQDKSCIPDSRLKQLYRPLESFPALTPAQLILSEWMKKEYYCTTAEALRLMLPAQMRGQRVAERVLKTVAIAIEGADLEDALRCLAPLEAEKSKAPRQLQVLEMLRGGPIRHCELERMVPGASSAVSAMLRKGWVKIGYEQSRRTPYASIGIQKGPEYILTPDQEKAVEELKASVREGRGSYLLHGVTGSGKTEVYLRAISECIRTGKTAIVLVPEISLTPQMVGRFRERFGQKIAVLHSRLSAGERFDEWKRIRLGEVDVVIGARSAVFAPLKKPGLIVIDEEHEHAYCSETHPNYSAHAVAKARCSSEGAALLLGSATPSVETYYACLQGEYKLLELPLRIGGGEMPQALVVDMRMELLSGNRTIFSAPLFNAIRTCLDKKEQMMLFINRRGYSNFVLCRGCGHVLMCDQCDVSLTYHKVGGALMCHYCQNRSEIPPVCPKCGKPYLKQFGIGTQQVEEQVKKYFPTARVLRMDMDTTKGKDSHHNILKAFGGYEADVLIGTQMIAKGLHFPRVTLIGVMAADTALYLPDYRGAERTFQLITQVAGRAGREELRGNVVVQTYSPRHFAIECASRHDYSSFYKQELLNRKIAQFPPFALFVRYIFHGEDPAALKKQCEDFFSEVRMILEENPGDVLLAACTPAPISRIKGVSRHQVLLKLRRNEQTKAVLDALQALLQNHPELKMACALEINPGNMI